MAGLAVNESHDKGSKTGIALRSITRLSMVLLISILVCDNLSD